MDWIDLAYEQGQVADTLIRGNESQGVSSPLCISNLQ